MERPNTHSNLFMKSRANRIIIGLLTGMLSTSVMAEDSINFSRDIRPILSDNCFNCHGPDRKTRKADLSLDTREGALADLNGHAAIVPGKPAESELIARILTHDADDIMPPPESKKTLSEAQKNLLKDWITQGAEYAQHWAYLPPQKPSPPNVSGTVKNPIDSFILTKLKEKGLKPAKEASRETLIRRVALDLTGLPPTPTEVNTFLTDQAKGAYERMVDRHLASKQYGEHMARYWLDIARYADTDGYQYDKPRTQWPWRDWVIEAYNSNKPFDEFTVEQLAGDRLPNPTEGQRIATGFNRNHPITIEGGIIDEEYRVEYVMDRVVTTTQAWLAMSIGCARCHDHKYDPVSQDEFYQVFSFFNSVADKGMSGFSPQLAVQHSNVTAQQVDLDAKLKVIQAEATPTTKELAAWEKGLRTIASDWKTYFTSTDPSFQLSPEPKSLTALKVEPTPDKIDVQLIPLKKNPVTGRYVRISVPGKNRYLGLAEVEIFSNGENVAKGKKTKQSTTGFGGPASRAVDGNTDGIFSKNSITHTLLQADPWWEVDLGESLIINQLAIWNRTDCCSERLDEFAIEVLDEARKSVWEKDQQPAPTPKVSFDLGGPIAIAFTRHGNNWLPAKPLPIPENYSLAVKVDGNNIAYKVSGSYADAWRDVAAIPPDVAAILRAGDKRTPQQIDRLKNYFLDTSPTRRAVRETILSLEKEKQRLASLPTARMLVMQDLAKPRKTYFLERGQYDQRRHELQPGVPAILGGMDKSLPADRLGFAKWLVNPNHPLTARVAVNRYWQRLFGVGIVKTLEEFGAQGEWPSHPRLLDWLATEFMQSGWDIKGIQRLMVTSAAYRRSSNHTPEQTRTDPENRWLARGPRFRLDAEVIRDSALAFSGLLEQHVGGPSVYPYQPKGLWMEINNRPGLSSAYPNPAADQLYRRSLYTFWKRSLPNPQMQTFDAPNREFCVVKRSKTNTPLQALALMHDPQYVEAGRRFARRILKEGGSSVDEKLIYGFRLVTGRSPSRAELHPLKMLMQEELARFKADPPAAETALSVGLSDRDQSLNPIEHAVWTTIARLLLNLDEVINKG